MGGFLLTETGVSCSSVYVCINCCQVGFFQTVETPAFFGSSGIAILSTLRITQHRIHFEFTPLILSKHSITCLTRSHCITFASTITVDPWFKRVKSSILKIWIKRASEVFLLGCWFHSAVAKSKILYKALHWNCLDVQLNFCYNLNFSHSRFFRINLENACDRYVDSHVFMTQGTKPLMTFQLSSRILPTRLADSDPTRGTDGATVHDPTQLWTIPGIVTNAIQHH